MKRNELVAFLLLTSAMALIGYSSKGWKGVMSNVGVTWAGWAFGRSMRRMEK